MNIFTRKTLALLTPLAVAASLSACSDNDSSGQFPFPEPPPAPPPTGGGGGETMVDVSSCLNQEIPGTGGVTVAGAVVPDTLTFNLGAASGFPNGRALPDPVIDVTLAVIFLDLQTHSPTTFFDIPLNPPANDLAFRDTFPYLAAPQGSPPAASTAGTNFTFESSADSAYARVDRMGMPAVSTALIPTDSKVPYNDASPVDDADGAFVDDITSVLTGLTEALADDLDDAGLTPCATIS